MLQETISQIQGVENPDPDRLSAALAETRSQFDSSVANVDQQTRLVTTEAQKGITQGQQQVVGGIAKLAQTGVEESASLTQEAITAFNELNSIATENFAQLRKDVTENIEKINKSSKPAFNEIAEKAIETANKYSE